MEYFRGNALKFPKIRGFAQAFCQLVRVFEMPYEHTPMLFQAEHGISWTAEILNVLLKKLVMKKFQLPHLGTFRRQHAGITYETSADHNSLHFGKTVCDFLNIGEIG